MGIAEESARPDAHGVIGREDIFSLPKAEVHVHLEGCFDAEDIAALAAEAGEPLPADKSRLFEFSDLSSFLAFLDWTCGLVRTPEQLRDRAYAFCKRLQASGTGYADVIVNPTHWPLWQWRLQEFVEALDSGFAMAEADGLPPVGLCVSLLRQQSAEESLRLVDTLLEIRHPRVVALSIDGNEAAAGRTADRFADAFRRAGGGGLFKTVHAGESSGPDGVRDAIDVLGADRLDHGVRAIEDPRLVTLLSERQVPLGICPTANIVGGLYPDISSHPLESFRKAGVPISINTDDPGYLGTSLVEEYLHCVRAFGWGRDVLRDVAATSIISSFAAPALKTRLLTELAKW